jgi:hypothetical protein
MRKKVILKEHLIKEINRLNEEQLQELEDFLFFFKFRSRISRASEVKETEIAKLYSDSTEEDRVMSEEGFDDYLPGLLKEDKL